MGRWKKLFVASSLVGISLVVIPDPASAIVVDWKAFHFNACGYSRLCDAQGDTEVADAIAQSIKNGDPDLATLNEICNHQLVRIVSRLGELGEVWNGFVDATVAITNDPHGRPNCLYGNAILWPGSDYKYVDSRDLYIEGGDEPRKVTCALFDRPKPLFDQCVTHLISSHDEPRRRHDGRRSAEFNPSR